MADLNTAQTIVFFDGLCHLCNGFVDFAVQRDEKVLLRFAPLQGPTASRVLGLSPENPLQTVFVWHQGRLLSKSDAVLQVFSILGGPWRLVAQVGGLLPRSLRNLLYDFVAKRRSLWFGERTSCRLPSAEEKSRFLD